MKYHENYEVTCHVVDENNHIRPSDVIRYMQETANHQMRDRKPSYYDFFYEGKAFIVTRMSVQIYKQLEQYDKIDVNTWRCEAKAATFPRCYEILRDGELIAESYSEWAVPNRITGKLSRKEEVDISTYEKDEVLDLELPKRFRFPKDTPFEKVAVHHVTYSDCDMNRHMNNANYSDILWDLIPEVWNKEVTSMNIRFMKEAAYGSDIEIWMAKMDPAFGNDPVAEEMYGFITKVDGKTNVEYLMGLRKTEKHQ